MCAHIVTLAQHIYNAGAGRLWAAYVDVLVPSAARDISMDSVASQGTIQCSRCKDLANAANGSSLDLKRTCQHRTPTVSAAQLLSYH